MNSDPAAFEGSGHFHAAPSIRLSEDRGHIFQQVQANSGHKRAGDNAQDSRHAPTIFHRP